MYREREDTNVADIAPWACSAMPSPVQVGPTDPELEHYILGSWNTGQGLKENGLMKKARLRPLRSPPFSLADSVHLQTISLEIDGTTYHLVSYYYPSDVRSGVLQTPSSMPHLMGLRISTAVTDGLALSALSAHGGRSKRGGGRRSTS